MSINALLGLLLIAFVLISVFLHFNISSRSGMKEKVTCGLGVLCILVSLIFHESAFAVAGLGLIGYSDYCLWNERKGTYHSNNRSIKEKTEETKSGMYSQMPMDAHDQIEKLAKIINEVYRAYPFAKNDFAKGSLYIYQESGKTTINFWYDWDYSGIQDFLENRYIFGTGFSFPDEERIMYSSNSVTGLDQWLWNQVCNCYYVDPAIATLQNNCPGLYIINQEVFDTGIRIQFSYR